MAEVLTLENNNFEDQVINSELPVLVDFWAPWCGPCKMIGPIIDNLAVEYSGKIKVGKLNVDENKEIAVQFGIRGIPTILFFKDGTEVQRVVGAKNKEQLNKLITEVIGQ
ncbi:Thioredoxin [Candidatus Syntrophocurvum alkaliphilum]|uniref:Thioredoxin n=1 Tax=Candidatus Syntrophocurvum alkaliphilum TaxID=2293317 RepID=A0A6I6DC24_9FIRM|nr:thioredoxin [Candidatus Syntrophocurvum alkaliphilum]QGT98895.1 Thioredoxin [Candidatus Syntrophocurvum alkaliphilum]